MIRRSLPLFLLLLFVTRAALVLANADVFFYGEELGKGAAAKALLDGLPVDYIQKNYGYHEGGGFVVTHLKALAFLVVGENVLAHKLVALLATSLILIAGWRLCRAHLGERAAAAFALLFVLCPAAQLRFSLLNLGTHFEALLFITLVLHLALVIGKAETPRARDLVALGATAGFGLYFSLQTAPASACAAAWLLWHGRGRGLLREALVAIAGLAIGLLPLLWSVAQIGMAAIRPAPQSARPRASLAVAVEGFASALRSGDVFDWLYLLAFVITGFLAVAWNRSARLIAGWLALYLLLYFSSGLATGNENWFFFLRLVPLWFGGMFLFGAALEALTERSRNAGRVVSAVLALLALGGLLDLRSMLAAARPGTMAENARLLARTQGYEYGEYLDKFLGHLRDDETFRVEVVKHYEEDPRRLAPELAGSLFGRPTRELSDVIEAWRRAWGEGWELGLPGLGVAVDPSYGHQLDVGFARIERQPEPLRASLAEALGRVALGLQYDEKKLRAAAATPAPADLRAAFLRGGGWRLYKLHKLRPDLARAFIETLPIDARSEFERGWLAAAELHTLR